MSRDIFIQIYKKAFEDFNLNWYLDGESSAQRDCDTLLYEGKIDFIEILSNEKDPEDEYNHRLVFKYQNNFYACPYREGSYGSGICFYTWDLKEVQPKTKEVVYYE